MEACLPVERSVAEAVGARCLPASSALQTIYRGPWDNMWQLVHGHARTDVS